MKKNHINILIQDTNQYFAEGLTALLHAECQRRNISVTFLTPAHSHRADFLIVTNDARTHIRTDSPPAIESRHNMLVIQDRLRYQTASRVQPDIGVINRRDSINSVRAMIELMLARYHDGLTRETLPGRPNLTARQREILSALVRGLTPNRIAQLYGLSVKTVSTHKCAAMRELGLARVHDLHLWLHNQNALTPVRLHLHRAIPASGNGKGPSRA